MRLGDVVEVLSIATPKVTGYLLNLDSRGGESKARYLIQFGFDPDRPAELMDTLLEHGYTNEIATTEMTADATVYTVEGAITSPDGRKPGVRTVWQVDSGSNVARLITAIPRPRRKGNQ